MQVGGFRLVTPVLPVREQDPTQARSRSARQPRHYSLRIAGTPKGPTPDPREAEPVGEATTTLRGAGVDVDARRVGRVFVAMALVALAVFTVVLFVAGAHQNDQITRLRHDGVRVSVTVTGCTGLLGGSGSNPVGFDCRGTFTLGGHRYTDAIPGNAQHLPGATLRGVTVRDDPGLFSTVGALSTQHPSARVFILPAVLLVVLALAVGGLVLRRRHLRPA
jgi:hypothetical protein